MTQHFCLELPCVWHFITAACGARTCGKGGYAIGKGAYSIGMHLQMRSHCHLMLNIQTH